VSQVTGLPAKEPPPENEDGAASRGVLLLIEDDTALRDATSELLEDEGFSVVTAIDGRDALDLLRAGLRPSVIVLDLMMPRMDGWDFRHIQMADQRLKDIPVVVVTAAGFRSQFREGHFVAKPVDPVALIDAIVHVCKPS
jgi:CheY-like chemotaxis protein